MPFIWGWSGRLHSVRFACFEYSVTALNFVASIYICKQRKEGVIIIRVQVQDIVMDAIRLYTVNQAKRLGEYCTFFFLLFFNINANK